MNEINYRRLIPCDLSSFSIYIANVERVCVCVCCMDLAAIPPIYLYEHAICVCACMCIGVCFYKRRRGAYGIRIRTQCKNLRESFLSIFSIEVVYVCDVVKCVCVCVRVCACDGNTGGRAVRVYRDGERAHAISYVMFTI